MTIGQALSTARDTLAASNIEYPSLESELLLMETLEIDRVRLYLKLDCEISPEQGEKYRGLIERRLNHEPTAYITGHREFYGLDFYVDANVLIPRPETELLVEQALGLAQDRTVSVIAEIGTGCGAIAINLALNLSQAKIYATDISTAALEVARLNCQKHAVTDRICLLSGDMLEPVPGTVDLIVANLPYVSQSELSRVNTLNFEPSLALDGGPDGLEKIRRLGTEVGSKLRPGGCLLLEIGQGQRKAVTAFLRSLFPSAEIAVAPDLSGIERVVCLSLPSNDQFIQQAENGWWHLANSRR